MEPPCSDLGVVGPLPVGEGHIVVVKKDSVSEGQRVALGDIGLGILIEEWLLM